jgi:hypothetical protein
MRSWRDAGERWVNIVVAALVAGGFALTLWVFYPGVLNYDARYVYSYIAARQYGDWQSPAMTVLWGLIDPIAPGTASIFLLIALTYWLAFAVLAFAVARKSPLLSIILPLLALVPPAFAFVGMIWRDVLFAVAWLLSSALVFATTESTRLLAVAQAAALALLGFGVLLRPNALLAAPLLAGFILWPGGFTLRRTALLYLPAAVALFALVQVVYYGVLEAKRQHPLQSIMVFDLGGISHFSGQNQFPGQWTPQQTARIVERCYRPTEWNIYWTYDCTFVMQHLDGEKIFGSPRLVEAWRHAVARHPRAYARHRLAFMWNFLAAENQTIWTQDLDDPEKTVMTDRAGFMRLKAVHDALLPTALFRAGTWLALCAIICGFGWRRRNTPAGAFALGVCGSAAVYVMTFLAVGVASDFRYAYWAVLAAIAGGVAVLLPAPPQDAAAPS